MSGLPPNAVAHALLTECPQCHARFVVQVKPPVTPLEQAFLDRIPEGGYVVDGGAAVGRLAGPMAARVGKTGRVLAIEPAPYNFARLREALREFPQVRPMSLALAEADGRADLYLDGWCGTAHSLVKGNCHEAAGAIPVETRALDGLVQAWPRLDALKLDVQGAELRVLKGASLALAKHRPVLLVEAWPNGLAAFGDSLGALDAYVRSFGYRRIDAEGRDAGTSEIGTAQHAHTDWLYAAER